MARKNSNRSSNNKRKNGGKQKGKTKKSAATDGASVPAAVVNNDEPSPSCLKQQRDDDLNDSNLPISVGAGVTKMTTNALPVEFEQPSGGHVQHHHAHHQIPFKLDEACARSLLNISTAPKKYLGPKSKEPASAAATVAAEASPLSSSDSESKSDSKPSHDPVEHVNLAVPASSPDQTEVTIVVEPESGAATAVDLDMITTTIGASLIEAAPEDTAAAEEEFSPSPMKESMYDDNDMKESGIISVIIDIEPLAASELAAANMTDAPEGASLTDPKPASNISRRSSFSSWSEVDDLNTHAEVDMEDVLADGWNAVPAWTS